MRVVGNNASRVGSGTLRVRFMHENVTASVAVLVVGGPWILGSLTEYTVRLYQSIPSLIG